MKRWFLFTFVFSCFKATLSVDSSELFSEELFIKPLADGYVYDYFQFTTTVPNDKVSKKHFDLFPKSFGEVLSKYRVRELHLTLTQGFWRHSTWGYPLEDSPPGVELWAWFHERTENVDQNWTDLINVLSGMFCTSLNFMDSTNTLIPSNAFRPQGATNRLYDRFATKLIRYSALPREVLCTENLTPWKKLLPCGSRAGLGAVFNALKFHQSSYHSLGVHFRPVCQEGECLDLDAELKLTLSVVYDTVHINNGNPDWSFKKMFDRAVTETCALADISKVYVEIPKPQQGVYRLLPDPTEQKDIRRGSTKTSYAVYNIDDYVQGGHVLNVECKHDVTQITYQAPLTPVITAERFQSGHGQQKGGIVTLIRNNHPKKTIAVSVFEVVPWFLRMYFHTLRIETVPQEVNNFTLGTRLKPEELTFVQARDRARPFHLEYFLSLPPRSVTRVSFEFERALLKWTEYPPDANHGFYVMSSVISAVIPTSKHFTAIQQNGSVISDIFADESTEFFLRLHTETLLVTLPTPDFSMPYNVICLTCTVIAIMFGSVHNLTTRRFVYLDPEKHKGLLTKLKEKIKSSFGRKTEAVKGEEQKSEGGSKSKTDGDKKGDT